GLCPVNVIELHAQKILALLDELDKWQQESSTWQSVAEKQLAIATEMEAKLQAAERRIAELEALELVVNLPAYVDGRTLGYGEVNHMIDLCADAIEKAGHAAGIITKVGG
ncbi:hypothetical protein R2O78_004408, partial [Enterobacter kobei]|nr:hypothetical protein [Enterobacter kobei]